ncbi:MAG: RHS repeat-associated core domain-containing protein, partial [Dehalococcoidia bacterium]
MTAHPRAPGTASRPPCETHRSRDAGPFAPPSLVSQAYATPWGAPASIQLGATGTALMPQATTYAYDARQRLTTIQTGEAQSPWESQSLAMTYDDAGNVKTVTDQWSAEVATYTYDDLNRLTGMALTEHSQAAPGASYTYDTIGNMLTKQEGASPNYTLLYQLGGSNLFGAHTAWAMIGPGVSTRAELSYDPNGNLCVTGPFIGCPTLSGYHIGASIYTYDAENRLISMPDATAGVDTFDTYTYDAGGSLLMRRMADGSSTVYIGGVYEASYSAGGVLTGVVKYYPFGGRNVAMRDAAGAMHYLLADHLGSTVGMMGALGNIQALQAYWPYGAVRSSTTITQTDKLFTGQRQEPADPAGLGLYDYRARFYSTLVGRFVSADSVTNDGLNRYTYVRNNPLRLVDPSGLDAVFGCGLSEYCEHGTSILDWRGFVLGYWYLKGISFGPYTLDQAFNLLAYVTMGKPHWDASRTLQA